MDEQDRARLRKEYEIATDDDILQMLAFDKDEYEEGVYELVLEEARKRGLENRKGRVDPLSCGQRPPQEVPLKEAVISGAIVQEAIINLLEKRNIATREEIMEEADRIKKQAGQDREC